MLAKLSAGDLISQEAVYHSSCLVSLYNKAIRNRTESSGDKTDKMFQGIALAELLSYIEETHTESTNSIPVFKLADLAKLYTSRLKQLGVNISGRIHTTDLKNRILSNFPDMQAHRQGRNILLAFNEDTGLALPRVSESDFDEKAIILSKAAKTVRRDLLNTKYTFDGTFEKQCQKKSVPQFLLSLVNMIIDGSNIKVNSDNVTEPQTALTISQLLQFNSSFRRPSSVTVPTSRYHSTEREPPLMLYLGLLLHAKTRKRDLIDKLYDFGLCVSYDRILAISTAMGNGVSARFEDENVVCPPKLRFSLFTTAAVDNIDHNPSSTTAKGSLHGTGILFQHPSENSTGEDRGIIILNETVQTKKLTLLPDQYSNAPPSVLPNREPVLPEKKGELKSNCQLIQLALEKEEKWLNHVKDELEKENTADIKLSWAAYHASQLEQNEQSIPEITSLLPLFKEEAKSAAMMSFF